ncbi:hypothetical protein IFM89_035756 [Coptis chinensis]|uniref:HTH myb-type domain-containing protein n=1 Tax=Coptis chinensis TaxID=261450 RepID=A0A835LGS1_9MAGN|nr:hypothetical protein IFM89_035756 [Coptis chinensis]
MYHHNHQNGKNSYPSSRFLERQHVFLQGEGNACGDTGLVLFTDAKPRLKWTPELHERFIEVVNQLGGADKATPKTVMKLMGIPGLTLYHLKSHLQKYRLNKNLHGHANTGNNKAGFMGAEAGDRMCDASGALTIGSQTNKSLQISESLEMQIEVQRTLNEQLELRVNACDICAELTINGTPILYVGAASQRHLQLRIEAQGKYLQSVLEKTQETLGKQKLGVCVGLEDAKVHISQLVFKLSNECLDSGPPNGLMDRPHHARDLRKTKKSPSLGEETPIEDAIVAVDDSSKDGESGPKSCNYPDLFEENYKELKRWVDMKSSKYSILLVVRQRWRGRLGIALKVNAIDLLLASTPQSDDLLWILWELCGLSRMRAIS